MTGTIPHNEKQVGSRELKIRFSPAVTEAFNTLAGQAAKSPFFDSEMAEILASWGSGKATNVHDVMTALPLISEQMAEHVKATGDINMKDAWRDLCLQLPEHGFVVSMSQQRIR